MHSKALQFAVDCFTLIIVDMLWRSTSNHAAITYVPASIDPYNTHIFICWHLFPTACLPMIDEFCRRSLIVVYTRPLCYSCMIYAWFGRPLHTHYSLRSFQSVRSHGCVLRWRVSSPCLVAPPIKSQFSDISFLSYAKWYSCNLSKRRFSLSDICHSVVCVHLKLTEQCARASKIRSDPN